MSINHLLNQSATLSTKGSVDKYGQNSFGSATSIKVRFEKTKKTIKTINKEEEPIDGVVFVNPNITVAVGDKLTYQSVEYRVMKSSPIVKGNGVVNHHELLVQEWNL